MKRVVGEDTADLVLTQGVHLFKSVNLRGWPFLDGSISVLVMVRTLVYLMVALAAVSEAHTDVRFVSVSSLNFIVFRRLELVDVKAGFRASRLADLVMNR